LYHWVGISDSSSMILCWFTVASAMPRTLAGGWPGARRNPRDWLVP
jgi:hypothetical protein